MPPMSLLTEKEAIDTWYNLVGRRSVRGEARLEEKLHNYPQTQLTAETARFSTAR